MTVPDQAPDKGGRSRFVPTRDQRLVVQALCACGFPQESIARYLQISKHTVARAFKGELLYGADFIHAAAGGLLVQKALRGDRGCLFFLLERRFGWSNRYRYEVSGVDGKPLNLANIGDDQLAQVIAALTTSLSIEPGGLGNEEEESDSEEAGGPSMDADAGTTRKGV